MIQQVEKTISAKESELINRISELESQNFALRAENKKLREALGLPVENEPSEKPVIESVLFPEKEENNEILPPLFGVNKYSAPEEKIELFMSLFRGRTDIYAKRNYSKKHESGYYIPACKNE